MNKLKKLLLRVVSVCCITALMLGCVPATFAEEEASTSETHKEESKKEEPKQEEKKQEAPVVTEAPKPAEALAATEAPKPAEVPSEPETPSVTDAPSEAEPSKVTEAPSEAEPTKMPESEETKTPESTSDISTEAPDDNATPAPEATEEPTVEDSEVSKLTLSVKATTMYGKVGSKAVSFSLNMSGGLPPYSVSINVTAGGSTVYSASEWMSAVSLTPKSNSTHKIIVTVTDAQGTTVADSASVPVSSNETESSSTWEKTIPKLSSGMTDAERLIAVARSQLGYKESTTNFVIDESGNRQGYSRYGAYYGMPYVEWCAMFISFCLSYANVPESVVPRDSTCKDLAEKFGSNYHASGYTPKAGDLVFFHHSRANSNYINHVGIVTDRKGDTVYTIEGNSGKMVQERSYSLSDASIVGYGEMRVKHIPTKNIFFQSDDKGELIKLEQCAMAVPNEGFVFAYWTRETGEVVYTDATLSTDVNGVYTAHYIPEDENVHQAIEKAIEEYGWRSIKDEEVVEAPDEVSDEVIEEPEESTFTAADGGTVNVVGAGAVAIADEGCAFLYWINENGVVVWEEFTFLPEKVGDYTAVFEGEGIEPYVIESVSTFLAGEGGRVNVIGTGAAAIADEGYVFVNWTDADGNVASEGITLLPETVGTYTANFAAEETEVGDSSDNSEIEETEVFEETVSTFLAGEGGAVNVIGAGAAAVTNEGYVFVNWTDADGNVVSEGITLLPETVGTYTANFAAEEDEVSDYTADPVTKETEAVERAVGTFHASEGGSVNVIGAGAAAITHEGYVFVNWTDASGAVVSDSITLLPETFGAYTANFAAEEEETEPVTVFLAGNGGTVRIIGSGAVAIPDEGYAFAGWIDATGAVVCEETVFIPEADGYYMARFAESLDV